ncbi:hypothetical protein BYT27DRAFT_7101767 [Phlegmacium glaucopus]|nr:hypothetical protein BYT27DRAFT_7101767 [Phlegmacium glaucopus]
MFNNSHPWNPQQNPYPTPPPPISHKVWILDCKNCNMFLTNRGMKAVLLLRPNVSLYSSDVLPVNCSPFYKSSLSYMTPRTCECLTQSLCCHGCGSTIGYMIITPCSRCTSSISATNRVTNGHRFVFQSGEVLSTERHYIPNEKGVIPFDTTNINTASFLQPDTYPAPPQLNLYRSRRDSLSTPPPLEFASPIHYYSQQQPSQHDLWPPSRASHSPTSVHPHYPPSNSTDARSQPLLTSLNSSHTADQKYAPTPPPILKAGDVIFWHHLARSGEILGVVDDERARRPARESADGYINFDR